MADNFSGVSVTLDKTTYNKGDPITATLHGQATSGQTGTLTATFTVTDATGATQTFTGTAQLNSTVPESVKITAVSDADRAWTIAADGLSATAIA